MSHRVIDVRGKHHRPRHESAGRGMNGYKRMRRAILAQAHVLVYNDESGHSAHVASGLSRLGTRTVVVHTPLEAVVTLQNESDPVHAAFIPLDSSNFDMAAFCAFLRDAHPRVRRVAFATGSTRQNGTVLACAPHCERVLWTPRDRGALEDALDALGPS